MAKIILVHGKLKIRNLMKITKLEKKCINIQSQMEKWLVILKDYIKILKPVSSN